MESERLDAARLEAERLEAERLEAERREADRLEAERIAAARAAAEREEAERAAQARAEAERAEAERRAAEAAAAAKAREQAALASLLSAAASSDDPDEALDDADLDIELVDIFVEEGGDLLDHSDGVLARLRETPDDQNLLVELQRDLHTLKGGARMAGIMPLGELGHAMETLLEAVVANRAELGQDGVPLLERGFDRLHGMVTRVAARRAIGMPAALIDEFNARAVAPIAPATVAEAVDPDAGLVFEPAPVQPIELKPLSAPITMGGIGEDDDVGVRAPQEQVRIRADLLDRLVNYAGEVAIYRARLEQQLGAFRNTAAEMEQTNLRLRDQLRRLDTETQAQIIARYQRESEAGNESFDPLEMDRFSTLQQLSRALAESAADLQSLHGSMDDLTRQYETLLLQQSRVSSELQEGLMRTRMVPFDSLVPRLRRVIRQAAGETGKQAQLKLDGAQGELDRNVLERMTAPLEHMLRNAIAHGLETPETRRNAGKADEGSIRLAVRREGSEVVLQVSDDGAGINREAVRRRGIERGLIKPEQVIGDGDLDLLIFEPGFSTADEVSRLAGRGVGMDVVASEVRQLGGSIDIASRPGEGTTFTLRLPQTLAVTEAVFVRIGETVFAVPIASVRGVGRISREDLASADATYRYGGEDYVLHDLGALVGAATVKAEGQLQVPLLLVRSGDLRAAVAIDQVVGNREIVVKAGGPQLASVPGIFGATIMGDGRVVVILDVAPLVRRHAALSRDVDQQLPQAVEHRRVPLVMVVDDSVTVRKVTTRLLERNGFEVGSAKDGVDALERMAEVIPDLMLLDIEMPRMDGFEVATLVRHDERLGNLPIIMITSRTGEKHRERAMQIGVKRYLGKPYQEVELMRGAARACRWRARPHRGGVARRRCRTGGYPRSGRHRPGGSARGDAAGAAGGARPGGGAGAGALRAAAVRRVAGRDVRGRRRRRAPRGLGGRALGAPPARQAAWPRRRASAGDRRSRRRARAHRRCPAGAGGRFRGRDDPPADGPAGDALAAGRSRRAGVGRGGDGRRYRRPGRGAAVAGRIAGRLPARGAAAPAHRRRPVRQAGAADGPGDANAGATGRSRRAPRAGHVYVMPDTLGLRADAAGVAFAEGDPGIAALRQADSALLLLSGADPALVDAAMSMRWAGGLVLGQSTENCFDPAASDALVARGGEALGLAELSRQLLDRWPA